MDSFTRRQLSRLEWKINVIARAICFLLSIAVAFTAFAVCYYGIWPEWAIYAAFGAGVTAAYIFDRGINEAEQRMPYSKDSDYEQYD